MEDDNIQNSVEVQKFLKVNIAVPHEEVPVHVSKNAKKRREKFLAKQRQAEKEKPISLKWFFLSSIVGGILFALFTTWTSTPGTLEVKPNHIQKAKYTKHIHKIDYGRGVAGRTQRY